jgi:hypothetical protein
MRFYLFSDEAKVEENESLGGLRGLHPGLIGETGADGREREFYQSRMERDPDMPPGQAYVT